MTVTLGLREQKKRLTREAISDTAIGLFIERGFDQVSISEIAEKAGVSRRNLFIYFPTKEELVLQRFADHEDELARTVRERASGTSPLEALRLARLQALRQRDPYAGLNDDPEVLLFLQLVNTTESLIVGLLHYTLREIAALAQAFNETGFDPLTARLAASQVVMTERTLATINYESLVQGESADSRYPKAVNATNRAFQLLREGLGAASTG